MLFKDFQKIEINSEIYIKHNFMRKKRSFKKKNYSPEDIFLKKGPQTPFYLNVSKDIDFIYKF